MAFPPASSRYDKYDKADHDAAVLAAAKDPVIELLVKPPLTRAAVPQEAPPPLLRQAAVMPGGPYKFSDKSPEKPEKGNLQPDTDYKRINLPLDADLHAYDQRNNVDRYVAAEREAFVVQIESTMTRLDGQPLDGKTLKGMLPPQGAAKLGAANGVPFEVPDDWKDEGIMWVCMCAPGSDEVMFYSSVCQLQKVHHSSFGTDGVLCAGEWIVRKGKLKKISANSGHYRPTLDALYRAVLHLACARQPDSTIFLYDTKLKVWADVNWADFIAKPSGGGRYSTHPDSPVPK
ncbi:MAG TPA: hypothetical protein VFI56_16410 [Vicinamibacterales bacterium]|nr:hypothetical protein [Vicinamibacterales bacterium]